MGYELFIPEAPEKIITLAPNLTEMVFSLGLENKLAGNTTYCNYPPVSDSIPKVGDLLNIDLEKILMISPDLIFITVEGNTKGNYEKLKEAGFKVFISNPRDFEGIKKTYRDISGIFNISEVAEKHIAEWNACVEKVKMERDTAEKKSIFLVSIQPVMAAGCNTYINEFLKYCGLKNIACRTDMNYPVFSREEILVSNPDIIIISGMEESQINITGVYSEWKNLKAVKNDNVIIVEPDLFFRPGPRFTEALENLNNRIRRDFHPRQIQK